MACSKYTLTNTGSTIVNFNYQRCDDAMWEYQVELTPNQTKNIWLLNGTYSTAFSTSIVEVDLGVFPPLSITPTPTPTVSITPSNSPTPSVTPSNTGTVTPTATNTPTVTQTGTPNVTQTQTLTPTTTTTQTQTGTPNVTSTQTLTPTPSITASQTPTGTPEVSPTNTPTLTQTPTVTTTQTVTPSITASPTPSSFGTNTFKVTMINTARAIFNNYTLTQIPYFVTPGVGFTGTTGTYPLSATTGSSVTAYGTHSAFVFGNVVSFEVSSTGSNSATIFLTVNGTTSTSNVYSIATGVNTLDWTIADGYSSSDTLEFRIQ